MLSKQKAMEADIMSDVPNWEAQKGVYNSRWMPAMTVFGAPTPPHLPTHPTQPHS